MGFFRSLRRDVSIQAVVAGLIAVLVGYSGSLVLILEAARAAGLDLEHTTSWVWAVSIGSGISGLALTLLTRTPVITAWSTPGAALLIGSVGGFNFNEIVGAFLIASLASTVFGATGWFGWLVSRLPEAVLHALLAGVLLPFIITAVPSFESAPLLAGAIVITFFLGKRFFDRYAVPAALAVGVLVAALTDSFGGFTLSFDATVPVITMPSFTVAATMTIALPLFVVTMAAQNAPGLAVLKFEGYKPNDRFLVGTVSAVSTAMTPFGNHGVNLAAITAAIATGPEAHPDKNRRYIAGITAALAYLFLGSISAQLTAAFASIPAEAITTLAAVALLGSTLGALRGAVTSDIRTGFASLVTLAVTMSGVVLLGVGSAFWGILAGGCIALFLPAARAIQAVDQRDSEVDSA